MVNNVVESIYLLRQCHSLCMRVCGPSKLSFSVSYNGIGDGRVAKEQTGNIHFDNQANL